MDNSLDLPGYKYYVDAETGQRAAVFVTFVNIEPEPECAVDGVVFPAADDELPLLDARERNYERRRVGEDLWAFVGTGDARARYERGAALGTAVVDAEYLRLVCESFPDIDRPDLPVRALRRIDIA
jgi:hypothetical protein